MPTVGSLWQREEAQDPEGARKMGCKGLLLSRAVSHPGARPCAWRCLCFGGL